MSTLTLRLRRTAQPAAIALDLMLPGRDGLAVIEGLRHAGTRTPVLILTAKRSIDDRVKGLQTGGDDYLTKPFAMPELMARVQALIRRSQGTPESPRLVVGDLALDRLARPGERPGPAIR